MFILMPTCDTHAGIASISLALLRRYWAEHPRVEVLHHAIRPRVEDAERITFHDCGAPAGSSWLQVMRDFLGRRAEELFCLLLDDYALCGPARVEAIERAVELMRKDASIGMMPLCWYPAARRLPRLGQEGIVDLRGAPILLQGAIWRRSWFLQLAGASGPNTSPWSFEAAATRAARLHPSDICAIDTPEPAYLGGHLVDGFSKAPWPLPYHNLMHGGKPELAHEAFLLAEGFSFPSAGLGDTVARLARASGAARVAGAVTTWTGRPCGCHRRRATLNRLVPYRS